jgi:hypothetical protein
LKLCGKKFRQPVGSRQRATSLGCRHGDAGANRGESIMSILSSVGYSAARARYRSERALLSLPIELRKDIGWPEIVVDAQNSPRIAVSLSEAR